VIIVRPTEKRNKKKEKRANDANRKTYLAMLAATNGKHEADSEASSTYELEAKISADEEAHQVAKVLGLPAAFDPTIKPLSPSLMAPPRATSRPSSPQPAPPSPEIRRVVNVSASNAGGDSDEDEEEEEDAEFEVMTGQQALVKQQKLEQLHKMEVGEAAALKMGVDDEEDDDDESPAHASTGAS
jgi:hypothetical protein